MLYYSYTLRFSLFYSIVAMLLCVFFVLSLMAFVCQEIKGLLTYLLYSMRCRSSDETPWSPPLIDFQSSRRPPVAMCYCRRAVVCNCRPSTLEQSTC